MTAVLAGIAQHGILPWDVGEATKVGRIGKLRATGGNALVAACARDESVAHGDGAHRCFQQSECRDAAVQCVRQNFSDASDVRPTCPGQRAGCEPSCVKTG